MRQKLKINHPAVNELAAVLSQTDDQELLEEFLESILTPNELAEVSTRWALVRLIDDGISQRKVADQLGLSLCKITRGSKELQKENSAFQRMINIFKEIDTER